MKCEMKKISVGGLGYIGLPTAIVLADAGHQVYGYDANPNVRESLKNGKIHIVEKNLQEAFTSVLESGHFHVSETLEVSDVYILCVPTPFIGEEKKADIRYVKSAAELVGNVLKKGDLVILESTVPPHTTSMMNKLLAEPSGLKEEDF